MVYILIAIAAVGVYYLIYKLKCEIAEEKADNDIERLKGIQKRFNLSNYHMRRMAANFSKYKYHDRFISKSQGVDIDRINEVIYWDYSEDYAWDLFYNINVSLKDKIGFEWCQIPIDKAMLREARCHPSDLYRKVKINEIRYVLDKEGLYPIPENGVQHRITQGGDMGTKVFQDYIYDYCKAHSKLEESVVE